MDRRRVEARLDELIQDNRVTIAITFPLVGVALLVAGREGFVPGEIAFHPALLVTAAGIMALPLIGGLVPLIGRRELLGLAVLACFSWGIELTGVTTGQPYGVFEYTTELGPMLFGKIPVALPVFYFPILLNSYLLVVLVLGDRARSFLVRWIGMLVVVLTMDLVLDPGAVALGFWAWDDPTAFELGGVSGSIPDYYSVPLHNYLGWVLSGSVAVSLLAVAFDYDAIDDRLEDCEYFLDDLISFGVFWGLVNAYFGNVVPFLLAAALLGSLFYTDRFDFAGLPFGAGSSTQESAPQE